MGKPFLAASLAALLVACGGTERAAESDAGLTQADAAPCPYPIPNGDGGIVCIPPAPTRECDWMDDAGVCHDDTDLPP